jgi:hypothetical protein
VAGSTLMQRIAPDELLTRVFGVLEGIGAFAWAIGSVFASLLITAFGVRVALVATGLLAPAVMLALWAPLASIDRDAKPPDAETLAFLRSISIFALLPAPAIERIASHVAWSDVAAGDVVIREGEVGDRFFMIVDGEMDVTRAGVHLAEMSAGDHIGEIALLHDVPRTATVTARTPARLLTLERDPFLEAVTRHPQSRERAEAIAEKRLRR